MLGGPHQDAVRAGRQPRRHLRLTEPVGPGRLARWRVAWAGRWFLAPERHQPSSTVDSVAARDDQQDDGDADTPIHGSARNHAAPH